VDVKAGGFTFGEDQTEREAGGLSAAGGFSPCRCAPGVISCVLTLKRPVADFTTRPLEPADQFRLWDWLHLALWDPPPAPRRPREVLDHPGVSIYAEGWGREGDVGVVGEMDGKPIGACWVRLIPGRAGLGHVDDETPQLGIALEPEYRGRGFGRRLMLAALEAARAHGYRQVSLTVHPQNPAGALYESCGFQKREVRTTYHLMVVSLGQNGESDAHGRSAR